MKRKISILLVMMLLWGLLALPAAAQDSPSYTLSLPDGTELESDSGRLLAPKGADTIQIRTESNATVKDSCSGRILAPDAGTDDCYTIRMDEHPMYGDELELLEKSFSMLKVVSERKGEQMSQLQYQTGKYSSLLISAADSADLDQTEAVMISWQMELPSITGLRIDGAIQYTPVNIKDHVQKFVLEKNASEAVIHVTVSGDTAKATLQDENGESLGVLTQEEGGYRFTMTDRQMRAQEDGTTLARILVLENAAGNRELITFTAACRRLDGPDTIVDYLCLGSQYSDGGNRLTGVYGLYPEKALIGLGYWWSPISIGNFGGYITYYYEDPIRNDPQNPYGIDFIVYGNSNGGSGFSEPGNVLVSEDGKTWYTLAGSEHYEDRTDWNGSVTYERMAGGGTLANGFALEPYRYPSEENYPLHDWQPGEDTKITVNGVELDNIFPAFGYADVHTNSMSAWGTGTNVVLAPDAKNPYWPVTTQAQGLDAPSNLEELYEGGGDGFDLAWAVDSNGRPVKMDEIHYIKVQSSMLSLNVGGIGEKSPEVNSVTRIAAASSDVGVSAAPKGITVAGQALELKDGVYEYKLDSTISGPFTVSVDASENANVYIGNLRAGSRDYILCPQKHLLRIIVQDGEKAPLQYFIHLKSEPLSADQVSGAVGQTLKQADASADTPFTRAMACAALYTISGDPAYEELYYLDAKKINQEAWYTDAANWAFQSDILQGYSSQRVNAEDTMTRAQWAAFMARYAALFGVGAEQASKPACGDAGKVPEWASASVAWAIAQGLLKTDAGGDWNPSATVSSSEINASLLALSKLLA